MRTILNQLSRFTCPNAVHLSRQGEHVATPYSLSSTISYSPFSAYTHVIVSHRTTHNGLRTLSTKFFRFTLALRCTWTYLASGDVSILKFASHTSTSNSFPGPNRTPLRFSSIHRALSSIRSTSALTTPVCLCALPFDVDLAVLSVLRRETTIGTVISGKAMLP